MRDSLSSSPEFAAEVIDMNVKQRNPTHGTLALYISNTYKWNIPNDSIPIDPQKVIEWEQTGQRIINSQEQANFVGLAQQATQLIGDYITLRRFPDCIVLILGIGRTYLIVLKCELRNTETFLNKGMKHLPSNSEMCRLNAKL
jgi:hypothetical protein